MEKNSRKNIFNKKSADYKIKNKVNIEKTYTKYASGKLCKIVLHEINDKGHFNLDTPFGSVKIWKHFKAPKNDATIKTGPLDYIKIAKCIELEAKKKASKDKNIAESEVAKQLKNKNKKDKKKYKEIKKKYTQMLNEKCIKIILEDVEKVLQYLSIKNEKGMEDIKSFKKIINTKMNLNRNPPKENYDSAFTNLCGLLMFCEPYRFKDGGGFSRQSIRATIKELKNNNINALSKIFGNKGKFYKGKFESEAVFAHKSRKERIKVKTNENNKTIKSNEYSNNKRPKTYGGKNQTINFIESTKFNENDDSINDNVERIEKYADEMSDNEDFDNEKLKNNYEEYDETEWENKFPPDKKKDDDGDDKIIINTSKNKISKKNKVKEKPYLPIKNLRNNKNKGVKTRQQTENEDIDSKTNSENIKKIVHKPKKDINTMDSSKNKRKLLNRKRKPDKVNKNMKKEMEPQLKKKKFTEDN